MRKIRIGLNRRRILVAAVAAISPFACSAFAAENDVVNGQTNLAVSGTYSAGGPATTDDVTWTAIAYSPAAFTLNNASISVATLNDLATNPITVSNTTASTNSTITLNGGSNAVAAANGGTTSDVIFVKSGSTYSLNTNTVVATANTLSLALGSVQGVFNVAGTATITAATSGTNGVRKTGSGTLFFGSNVTTTASNTFTGGVFIDSGTLVANSNATVGGALVTNNIALGANSGSANATLQFNRNQNYLANTQTITVNSGGTMRLAGGPGLSLNQTPTVAALIALNNPLTLGNGAGGAVGGFVLSGQITGSATITVDGANAGDLTTGGAGSIVTLSGTNTTTLSSTINVNRGSLRLTGTNSGGIGTVNVQGATPGSSSISGTGAALGDVIVTNGNVLAPGSNATNAAGNLQFGTSGTLGLGTGTVANAGADKTLTLTNANLFFDLNTVTTSGNDQISANNLALGSSVAFTFNGLGATIVADGATAYTLINAVNAPTGFNTGNFSTTFIGTLASGGYTATYSINGTNDLVATFTTVPEPASLSLIGLGGLGLLRRRRSV